jgi:CubicO group peptidase (beta-lactamase class C family)
VSDRHTGTNGLPPLPRPDDHAVWPGAEWESGPQTTGDPERLAALLDPVFAVGSTPELGQSLAFVAVQGGRVVAERYGPGVDAASTLISWSMAKSITHGLAGLMCADGRLDVDAPLAAPEWAAPDDPRNAITTRDLLLMRSGLRFVEDYVDDTASDCLSMLWGDGADDVGHYAASLPLEHPIGSTFNYSSGTTNIITRHLGGLLGGEVGLRAYLDTRLFGPLGMRSATPKFDAAGTWVGSSYVFATARDYARFGLWYLRDGIWQDERLLPEGWVDAARTGRSVDDETGWGYGEHWWVRGDRHGTFWANGYEGQLIMCVPGLDLVIVRLGKTPSELRPHREAFVAEVLACFEH